MPHEFDGKEYERASAHQREWGDRLIADLGLRGQESVLDLGCGDGALTARIAALVPGGEVLGIDASQGMIDAAKPKAGGNLCFRLMDINGMDFDERFDVVFSNAALHWVKDHARLFSRIRRALRPGGRVRVNFAGDGNCSSLFRVLHETMALPEFAAAFDGFEWPWNMPTVDSCAAVVEASGLCEVRVWGENADRYFADRAAMTRWVDQPSLVPFLPHVRACDRRAFRDRVVARMVEETQCEDGRFFETFRRVNVSATC